LPTTFAEPSAGAEWMRSPSGLSTVRELPTIAGVGLGVGLVAVVGTLDGVGDVLDGAPPQAAMSAAVTAGSPAAIRQRARADSRRLTP
jgi:hypothetical protein